MNCWHSAFGKTLVAGTVEWRHTGASVVDNSRNSSPDPLHASANAGHAPNLPCFQATKEPGRGLSGQHFGLWRQHDSFQSLMPGQGLKTAKLQPVSDSGEKPEAGSRLQSTSMHMPS